MRNQATRAKITLAAVSAPNTAEVEVLGEPRRLSANRGEFSDDFEPYEVHLYRIR
jgi:hypothetical protein